MYQDVDPMHNLPRTQTISDRKRYERKTHIMVSCVLLFGLAGVFMWASWIDEVVPDKYIFNANAAEPDIDYINSRR